MALLGLEHGLGAVENPQLLEDLVDVDLDGLLADLEKVRDDFVGVTLRDQAEHFALAFGPADYFSLMVLAFVAVTSLLGRSLPRGKFCPVPP